MYNKQVRMMIIKYIILNLDNLSQKNQLEINNMICNRAATLCNSCGFCFYGYFLLSFVIKKIIHTKEREEHKY